MRLCWFCGEPILGRRGVACCDDHEPTICICSQPNPGAMGVCQTCGLLIHDGTDDLLISTAERG